MAKIRVTQVKSAIKRPANQKATIIALGLGRISKSNELEASPSVLGMVEKVKHLIKVEEL